MRLAVLFAIAATGSGCLGHTARERRESGGVALAAGAAMVVGGVLLARESQRQEGFDGLPEALGADVLFLAGVPTAAIGGFNVLSSFGPDQVVTEDRPLPLEAAEQRDAACATWQSNRDQERDPARRAALDAARPAHCRDRTTAAR